MGWETSVFPLLIVVSGQPNTGFFVYSGPPGPGNPPVLWAVAPGITADPFGNAVSPVFGVGVLGGPGLLIDQFGNLTTTGQDGSLIELAGAANLPFALTGALTGIMQSLVTLTTIDGGETQAGVVSGLLLGTGTARKMCTLISSPYGTSGMGLLLQAENDGASDTPYGTFGTVTTQGGTLTFQPVLAVLPGAMLLYKSGSTLVVVTKTVAGAYTIPIPAGVSTAFGEAWAGGQPGGAGSAVTPGGGGGGGGGEYAAEPALAVTGGGNVTGTVGAAGANTTMVGSAVTITAHAGTAGTSGNPGGRGLGGSGYAGTTSHPGGAGGLGGQGGGGGGSSGGTSASGNAGHAGGPVVGGAGGTAPAGGGAGSSGGAPGASASAGGAPGGGGGGGGQLGGAAGGGAVGQARLTYTTSAPQIIFSSAQASGTDQFGTAFNGGTEVVGADGNNYDAERLTLITPGTTINSTTGVTVFSKPLGVGNYRCRVWLVVSNTTAADAASWGFTFSGTATGAHDFTSKTSGTATVGYGSAGDVTTTFNNQGVAGSQGLEMNLTIKVTVAGTLALVGKELVSGNTVAVAANGTMEIMPVVAT